VLINNCIWSVALTVFSHDQTSLRLPILCTRSAENLTNC
jgi:hypothetical protein